MPDADWGVYACLFMIALLHNLKNMCIIDNGEAGHCDGRYECAAT